MEKRILVIDDDEAIRKSFVLTFEDEGYRVDTAESGEKGLEMRRETSYDLVFLDLKMPGIDGVETLRRLREMDKEVPVYIVTAFHKDFFQGLKRAVEDGIDFELLRKPVDSEHLILIARSALGDPQAY